MRAMRSVTRNSARRSLWLRLERTSREASSGVAPSATISSYRSSRWIESSSMISCSREGGRFSPTNCLLISCFQSGMLHPRDSADPADKFLPAVALLGQSLLTLRGQTVVTPPSLIGFFDPTSLNPAAILEPVEQRIQRSDVEPQLAPRAAFDELPDIVTMARLVLEKRENQQLSAAFLPFLLQGHTHMCDSYIPVRMWGTGYFT